MYVITTGMGSIKLKGQLQCIAYEMKSHSINNITDKKGLIL